MVILDFILGALLLYGLVKGLRNGFFVELSSLISLLIGIYLAIKFSYIVKESIGNHISWNPKTIQIIAFMITIILVIFGISLLAKVFTSIANFAFLGWLNTLAGGVIGVLKTALLISIFLTLFQKINFNHLFAEKKTLDNSLFFNPIQKIASVLYPSIEGWFHELKETKPNDKLVKE